MKKLDLIKEAHEHMKSAERIENMSKIAYEQLESAGVKCNGRFCYRGILEYIQIGKKGSMSIEEKNKKFQYWYMNVPEEYVEKIERVMKSLEIDLIE